MENYSYTSYPESGDSSPRSREIEFDNPPPWEDQSATNNSSTGNNYKVKFMCSYGGKIHPRPHDNQLSYIGGETKILAVDRTVKFSGMVAKLSALCDTDVCFKYQLPGEDLDALISVTNDDDLEHMMHEYDRLYRASPKPARLRLFLFPVSGQSPALTPAHSFGSTEGRSERERFVDALNSTPVHSSTPPSAVPSHGNADFLFGSEKGMPPPTAVVPKVRDLPIADPPIHHHEPEVAVVDDRGIGADRIQKHIQDLQRLRISEEQQQGMYRRPSDDNLAAGYTGDYYLPKMAEKVAPQTLSGTVPAPATGYQISGGFTATTISSDQQAVYMIPAPASMYHAPMARPVTGPVGQGGYYAVQRMPTEVYREQPVYSVMPPAQPVTGQQPTLPPQQQQLSQKVATYSEGIRMVQSTGVTDAGYTQMAYDNGAGRQVYYTAQGAVVAPPQQQQPQQPLQATAQQYQAMAAAAATLNQEGGKVVVPAKISQASV